MLLKKEDIDHFTGLSDRLPKLNITGNNLQTNTGFSSLKSQSTAAPKPLFSKDEGTELNKQILNVAQNVPKNWGDREDTISGFVTDLMNQKLNNLSQNDSKRDSIPSLAKGVNVKLLSGYNPTELSSYVVLPPGSKKYTFDEVKLQKSYGAPTLDQVLMFGNAGDERGGTGDNSLVNTANSSQKGYNFLPAAVKTGSTTSSSGATAGNDDNFLERIINFFKINKDDDNYDLFDWAGDVGDTVGGWFGLNHDAVNANKNITPNNSSTPNLGSSSSSSSQTRSAPSSSASSSKDSSSKATSSGMLSGATSSGAGKSSSTTSAANGYTPPNQINSSELDDLVGQEIYPYDGGQCTAYATQRSNEYYGLTKGKSYGIESGEAGLGKADYLNRYNTNDLTQLVPGAIAYFGKKEGSRNTLGHVIFIEGIKNGYIYFSDGNYLPKTNGKLQKMTVNEMKQEYGPFKGYTTVNIDKYY